MTWGDPALSTLLAAAYMGVLGILWLFMVLGVEVWARRWELPEPEQDPERWPRLSVCLPARDEEENLALCLERLLALDYPDLEVVVVNDRSRDRTGEIARAFSEQDPRVVALEGAELPPGWAGKCWACSRAAAESSGELLLFIDADVRVHPRAARAAVKTLLQRKLSLLSLFGRWELVTFWEQAIIPVIGWLIRGGIDLEVVNDPSKPQAFANGQFILTRREDYLEIGGHDAICAEVLDDVKLARLMKTYAKSCGMYHAPWAYDVRLYRSLREIVEGYTKNFYEGLDRRPSLALGLVIFITIGTLGPYLILSALLITQGVLGWSLGGPLWIAGASVLCGLIAAFRWRLERLDGRRNMQHLLHPLGNLMLIFILLRSMFTVQVTWKGRHFVDGKAER